MEPQSLSEWSMQEQAELVCMWPLMTNSVIQVALKPISIPESPSGPRANKSVLIRAIMGTN